jgi:hypothetical protein
MIDARSSLDLLVIELVPMNNFELICDTFKVMVC